MSSGSSSSPSSTSSKPPLPDESQTPARIPRLGWVIAFLVITMLIAWAYMQFNADIQSRRVASRLERFAPAPQFQFTAQDGSAVSTADFKGKDMGRELYLHPLRRPVSPHDKSNGAAEPGLAGKDEAMSSLSPSLSIPSMTPRRCSKNTGNRSALRRTDGNF